MCKLHSTQSIKLISITFLHKIALIHTSNMCMAHIWGERIVTQETHTCVWFDNLISTTIILSRKQEIQCHRVSYSINGSTKKNDHCMGTHSIHWCAHTHKIVLVYVHTHTYTCSYYTCTHTYTLTQVMLFIAIIML